MIKNKIIFNQYRDSVQLMRIAARAMELDGISNASLLMGTPNNKQLLVDSGLFTEEVDKAGPNDIIISLEAKSEAIIDQAFKKIDEMFNELAIESSSEDEFSYLSLDGAYKQFPQANLVVISVPGEYAAREANKALDRNLNVFLFSDNVPIEDEIVIKKKAHEKGLLVMGPDCGTAIIKNKGIGFANEVRAGKIGIVAASGTGTQEVTSLIHQYGQGITHALGTGSNDVKDKVGAITMIDALKALEADPLTEVIVIVSKPPEDEALEKVCNTIANLSKTVIVNFLGKSKDDLQEKLPFDNVRIAETLEEAAILAVKSINDSFTKTEDSGDLEQLLEKLRSKLTKEQKYVRGLFAGGTFTSEAAMILLKKITPPLYSNINYSGVTRLENNYVSKGHCLVDLGGDEFTVGRPHPMIDQTYRKERLIQESRDPSVAVIMLDFILGYGSHPDPVGDIKGTIAGIRKDNLEKIILAHVCGTDLDYQGLKKSESLLRELEVIVFSSNAKMADFAAELITNK